MTQPFTADLTTQAGGPKWLPNKRRESPGLFDTLEENAGPRRVRGEEG